MKGKKLIVLAIMLVLMMQMTGCGEEADSDSGNVENVINTWAGYEADAANGLRVKSAEFSAGFSYGAGREAEVIRVAEVTYDMEGNITSLNIYNMEYAPFFEKVWGISAPFKYTLESLIYYWDEDEKVAYPFLLEKETLYYSSSEFTLEEASGGKYVLKSDGESLYFLADGRIVQKGYMNYYDSAEGGKRTFLEKYNYDDIGRVTEYSREYTYRYDDGTTNRSVDTFRYTYVEDSLYIASRVHSHDGNFSSLGAAVYNGFWIITYDYDYDNHNIVRVKEYVLTDEMQINGNLHCVWEYEYDENGNVVCVTKVVGSDHGDITTRYQYDSDGNLIEECEYQTFGSEEYITSKIEYQYDIEQKYIDANDNKEHVRIDDLQRKTEYKYEANSDYSIVNLIDTVEGDWQFFNSAFEYNYNYNSLNLHEGYDEVVDCWTVTYYTQEEIDQYTHDQEFHRVN